jgi:hypothetical protein
VALQEHVIVPNTGGTTTLERLFKNESVANIEGAISSSCSLYVFAFSEYLAETLKR